MASSNALETTPTWALATVCFIIVSISIVIEHSIHLLTEWLKKHRKNALHDAVWRLKSELMLLGFMSLLLAVTQSSITNICVPSSMANTMLPCHREIVTTTTESVAIYSHMIDEAFADLVSGDNLTLRNGRRLAEDYGANHSSSNATDSCISKGKYSLITQAGILQLQIFIFVLAVMQIVYSVFTMALGRAKMRRWKSWEKETRTAEYQIANDPNRFRFTRQTTFGRRHTTCTQTTFQLWLKCFFRQFFHSVAKVDYLTLRHGFITAHMAAQIRKFDFQKYIEHSLDEDFKKVVSISPLMWFLVVIFLLVDVHGWHSYLWISYIPLIIILVLGTKLEVIVAKMALQLQNHNNVVIGTPLVQPNDDLFWFKRPRFVLSLLHLTLFVNAFELAFFTWVTIQFGLDSCYHEHTAIIITRVVLAVSVQVLCSYITLPLYALVTQMGSEFKSDVLNEEVAHILKQWHADVRARRMKQERTQTQPQPNITVTDRIEEETEPNTPAISYEDRPSTSMPVDPLNKSEITEGQT